MEAKPKTICGGCLCGAVRYEGIGAPYKVTHCHCEDCRKSAGAPFVTWASFRWSNFQFTKGKPLEIAWAGRVRSFCATCGSTLTFMSGPSADEIDVTVATFDQPEIIIPADHIWTEDRISWIKLADNLPQHARGRTECSRVNSHPRVGDRRAKCRSSRARGAGDWSACIGRGRGRPPRHWSSENQAS